MPTSGLVRVFALARYRGVGRRLLIAYKERGRRDLAPPLGWALAEALAVLPLRGTGTASAGDGVAAGTASADRRQNHSSTGSGEIHRALAPAPDIETVSADRPPGQFRSCESGGFRRSQDSARSAGTASIDRLPDQSGSSGLGEISWPPDPARSTGTVSADRLSEQAHSTRSGEISRQPGPAIAAGIPSSGQPQGHFPSTGPAPAARKLCLVPAPSRPSASRVRGGPHVERLAEAAASVLAGRGFEVAVAPALELAGSARDAVGLGHAQRAANLAGRLRFRHAGRPPPGFPVVVLDDVVTTGATAAACVHALAAEGIAVSAVLALLAAG